MSPLSKLELQALRQARRLLKSPEFKDVIIRQKGWTYRGTLKHHAVSGWDLSGRAVECHPAEIRRLVRHALDGDADRDAVLRAIASDMIGADVPLPEELKRYILPMLKNARGPRKRGRTPNKNKLRDMLIVDLVNEVAKRGLPPTRNEATDAQSSSSIVARAITEAGRRMSMETVVKIYSRSKGRRSRRTE